MYQILKMRLPTKGEWDQLVSITGGNNNILHWTNMYSWCQDVNPDVSSYRAVRGWVSARYWSNIDATTRSVGVGFRPAFEALDLDSLGPDGTITVVGTLYMDGKPVKVPTNPTWDGDIIDYIPEANLEFREALDNPAYQIQAIKVGSVLIADRVLLKNISWFSTRKAYVCRTGKDICTWKVPVMTFVSVEANSMDEALAIASQKADNMGASLRYKTPDEYKAYLNS